MSLNKKLVPYERANVLRSFGYKIDRNSGEISNIKNVAYRDKNPSLCINLDNGLCKDFGDDNFSGDIINLLVNQMGLSFKDIAIRIEEIIGRSLGDAPIFEAEIEKKGSPLEFYNDFILSEVKKMSAMLKKTEVDYISYAFWHDGIVSMKTLLKYGCGLYTYGDYNFNLSDKRFLINPFLAIPYKTGIMVYRRAKEKIVRHVKGSYPSESFFGVLKSMEKDGLVIIAKSPREAMSISEYLNWNYNVIGLSTGESIRSISEIQENQLLSITEDDSVLNVKLLLDCDDESAFVKAVKTASAIKNNNPKRIIHLCSIHHASEGKYKDFSDLFQASLPPDIEKPFSISSTKKLDKQRFDIFKTSIQKPIKII